MCASLGHVLCTQVYHWKKVTTATRTLARHLCRPARPTNPTGLGRRRRAARPATRPRRRLWWWLGQAPQRASAAVQAARFARRCRRQRHARRVWRSPQCLAPTRLARSSHEPRRPHTTSCRHGRQPRRRRDLLLCLHGGRPNLLLLSWQLASQRCGPCRCTRRTRRTCRPGTRRTCRPGCCPGCRPGCRPGRSCLRQLGTLLLDTLLVCGHPLSCCERRGEWRGEHASVSISASASASASASVCASAPVPGAASSEHPLQPQAA